MYISLGFSDLCSVTPSSGNSSVLINDHCLIKLLNRELEDLEDDH